MEGGAYINPRDDAALLVMHLSEGRCGSTQVISADGVRRMHADRVGPTHGATASRGQGYGLGWWVSVDRPGLIQDAGAFGAVPWIDLTRGYGAYLVIEDESRTGDRQARLIRPMIERVIDDAADR